MSAERRVSLTCMRSAITDLWRLSTTDPLKMIRRKNISHETNTPLRRGPAGLPWGSGRAGGARRPADPARTGAAPGRSYRKSHQPMHSLDKLVRMRESNRPGKCKGWNARSLRFRRVRCTSTSASMLVVTVHDNRLATAEDPGTRAHRKASGGQRGPRGTAVRALSSAHAPRGPSASHTAVSPWERDARPRAWRRGQETEKLYANQCRQIQKY